MEFDLGQVVGADGKGIVSIELISTSGKNKTYRITYTDDTYFDYTVKDGDDAISAIVTSWEQTLSDSKVPSEKLTKDTLDTKVDKVTGKGLSTEDYTTSEKTKLAGIEAEANKTIVDSSLSDSSTNPLQNKIVKSALDNKVNSTDLATVATTGDYDDLTNKLEVVDELTSTDTGNPLSAKQGKILNDTKVDKVTGKGLSTEDYTTVEKSKLAGIEAGANLTVVDSFLSFISENPVQNKVVKDKLDLKADSADLATVATTGNYDDLTNKLEVVDELTSTDTGNPLSAKQGKILNDTKVDKVTGKGLSTEDYTTAEKTKLAGVESEANKTVVDSSLSDSSINPVQNKVVKGALDLKADTSSLATVATTGDYDDLTNKPVIPPGVIVDQSLDSSSTNAVANQAVVGGLNGKSDTGHSHTWITQSLGSYGTLYVNETLRLVIFYYSRSYNYTSTNDVTLETGIIPSEYRPSKSIPCSCANPYIAGRVTLDNKLIVTPTKTGTIGTTLQAIWTY